MNKIKLFVENFLVYGFGGIISKLVPLIMLPIVTRLMPSSHYFGLSDMSNTIVSFCSFLAIAGMYDAMYRMFFENDDNSYKLRVCSTALCFTLFTSAVVFVLMCLFRRGIAEFFFESREYAYLVYLSAIATLVGATNGIVSAPTRMQNKRKIFLVTNTISPILSYAIAIPLLLNGYYVIALPLAGAIAGISMEIAFWFMNREWFSLKMFDMTLLKDLLRIGVPLIPNFIIYWIFNSSDRVMITRLINIDASGIYAIGAKLGMASQLIYTAFAGGWQYFAFSTMKENNQVESNSKVFEYLGLVSFAATMFICALAKPIYEIVFTEEYHGAFIVSPYLFLAPLLQMLFQVAANQFLVVKKTWPNLFILSAGAIINVILNLFLIPRIGIEGAAIATLVGYVISDIICVIVLEKMSLMKISMDFLFTAILMMISMIIWRLCLVDSTLTSIIGAIIFCLCVIIIYRKDVKRLYCLIRSKAG